MSRRWLLILGLPLLLVLLLAGGLALFRIEAATWFLQRALADAGYPDARFTVAEVGLSHATLTDLEAGPAAARRIEARFQPYDLIDGKLEAAEVEGLRLSLDLTQGLESNGESFDLTSLPPVTLRDAQVLATTAFGPVQLDLEGQLGFASGPGGELAVRLESALGQLKGKVSFTSDASQAISGLVLLDSGFLDLPGGRIEGLSGVVDFRLGGTAPPSVTARLSLASIAVSHDLFDTADLVLSLKDERLEAEGRLLSPDRKAEALFTAKGSDMLGEPSGEVWLNLKLEAGAALWPLLGLPQPESGSATLWIAGSGKLPPLASLPADPGRLLPWIVGGEGGGRLEIAAQDLTVANEITGLAGSTLLEWTLRQGLIAYGLPQDTRFTAARVAPQRLVALGLPDDTAAALSEGLTLALRQDAPTDPRLHLQPSLSGHRLDFGGTLELSAASGATASLALAGSAETAEGRLLLDHLALTAAQLPADGHVIGTLTAEGSLAGTAESLTGPLALQATLARTEIGGYPVEDLSLNGAFQATLTPQSLALLLDAPGQVSAVQVYQGEGGDPLLPQGTQGELLATSVTLDWSGDFLVRNDTEIALPGQSLTFGSLGIQGDLGHLHLLGETTPDFDYVGSLTLTGAKVTLPSFAVELGALDLVYPLTTPDASAEPGSVTIGAIAVQTGMGRLGGISFQGTLVEDGSVTTLNGRGRGPNGLGTLAATLTDNSETGRGSLTTDWGPVTFSGSGAQPVQILSGLKDFSKFAGGIRVALTFGWTPSSDSSQAVVTLTNAAFEHPQASVKGLNTKLTISDLGRLTTPAGQVITAELIDIGIPITNVTTKLRIEAGRSPIYGFSDIGFTLFGGRFTLDALRVDPRAAQVASTVQVSNMNLADVALELGISNFALEGRMSGQLPITYAPADETITIVKGRLTSAGSGAIRYGQPGTASLRAGGDENFTLALQALENFQYSNLDLTIDKAADGKARLVIVLEGNNPALLDGFPFKININLDTDLSQVLTALREGYRLNPDLFKGGWTFD